MASEPQTEAGRALFTDNEPMDMWESDGVRPADIAAVEQQAAAAERARLAVLVEGLDEYEAIGRGAAIVRTGGGLLIREAVLRLLSGVAS